MNTTPVSYTELRSGFLARFRELSENNRKGAVTLMFKLQRDGMGRMSLLSAVRQVQSNSTYHCHDGRDERVSEVLLIAQEEGAMFGEGLTVTQVHSILADAGFSGWLDDQ